MSIHEHLPPQARRELKEVGWTKGLELAKVARSEGQRFDCATWLHKARSLPKEEFKLEIEKELTGRESEPWEIVYFKLYKTQIPVVEQAMEAAALMLGTDTSRGYCLEMICADFRADASLEDENSSVLLQSRVGQADLLVTNQETRRRSDLWVKAKSASSSKTSRQQVPTMTKPHYFIRGLRLQLGGIEHSIVDLH